MRAAFIAFLFSVPAFANTIVQNAPEGDLGSKRFSSSATMNYEGLGQPKKGPSAASAYSNVGGSVSAGYKASEKQSYRVDLQSANQSYPSLDSYPSKFWSEQVGGTYHRKISERSAYDLGLSVGSSADRVWARSADLSFGLNFAYSRTSTGLSRWTYGLATSYSESGGASIPIPFAAYYYHYSDAWQFNLGAPLSATFAPTSKLSFQASYVPVKAISLESGYKVAKAHRVFLGYSLSNLKAYRQSDRLEKKESIYFDESKYFLGWSTEALKPANLQLSLAYVYNRDFWRADKPTDTAKGKQGLPNEWRAMTTASFSIL